MMDRKINKRLKKKLDFPENPTFANPGGKSSGPSSKERLVSLVDFCHSKNISFGESEQRFYELQRNRKNYKVWANNFHLYCDSKMSDDALDSRGRLSI